MLFFILAFLLIFFSLSFINLKYGYFLFVFLIPFTPKFIGLTFGSDGFSLGLKRIFIIILFFLLIYIVLFSRKYIKKIKNLYNQNKNIFRFILIVFLLKALATLINSFADMGSLFQLVNEFWFTLVFFFISIFFIETKKDIYNIFLIITAGIFFTEILTIIEYIFQKPVLSHFMTFEVDGENLLAGKYRDNAYRVMGGFENPLLLVEMLLISFPIVIYTFIYLKKYYLLAFIAIIHLPISLLFTGSSAGLAIFFGGILIFAYLLVYKKINLRYLSIFKTMTIIITICGSFIIYNQGVKMYEKAQKDIWGEHNASMLERIEQYAVVGALIYKKPIIGYGFKRNYANELDDMDNLDSYYLRMGLESGFLGILMFLVLMIHFFIKIFHEIKVTKSNDHKYFYITIFTSVIYFFFSKFVLSMPTNNLYLYLLISIFINYKKINAPNEQNQRISE